MAASTIYAIQSLLFTGSPDVDVPIEKGSVDLKGGLNVEYLRSGNSLTPDIASVIGKRPSIGFTTLDPSLLTALAAIGAGETITGVKAVARAYQQNGTLSSTYKSFLCSQGLILPTTLNFSAQQRATLDAMVMMAFSSGDAYTIGTDNDAVATVAKAYYPTSVVLGGSDTITDVQSGAVNFNYQARDDNSEEPEYYVVDSAARTMNFVSQDLANVSQARLEDGVVETVVLTLTNRQSGGGTVSVNLGTCFVQAEISGDNVTYQIAELTNP